MNCPTWSHRPTVEIVKENLLAAQAIYFAYQLDELRLFQVVERIVELFQQGQNTNDVSQALADAKVVKSLEEQGLSIKPLRGAAFREFIDSEMKKYQAIVTETGVSVEQ